LPVPGLNVTAYVGNALWMVAGQNIFIEGPANFRVVAVVGATAVTLTFLGYAGDVATGATISAGAGVTGGAVQFAVGALPTSLTDNSGGTVSSTIAAGVGIQTLEFYYDATAIANGDLLTNYVPGYKFKILKVDARCSKPVTIGAKQATLNLEIDTTNLTGGVVSLAGTYAMGAAQAGSAVTGNNTGDETQSFSIEASAVTAFTEGAFVVIVTLQNLDTANAVASLADAINTLISSLT
jgi:hypothetical protein